MSGSWQSEWGLPREDFRTEVGEDVRVGVGVGPMEFKLYNTESYLRRRRQVDVGSCRLIIVVAVAASVAIFR